MEFKTYSSVRNPKWVNTQNTRIVCEVNFDHIGEDWVEFECVASGDYPHTHEIYERCVAGDFGEVAAYAPPPDITGDTAVFALRGKRSEILAQEVDPIVSNPLRWESLSQEEKDAWALYRQQLLDITETNPNPVIPWVESEFESGYGEVTNVTWPTKPS